MDRAAGNRRPAIKREGDKIVHWNLVDPPSVIGAGSAPYGLTAELPVHYPVEMIGINQPVTTALKQHIEGQLALPQVDDIVPVDRHVLAMHSIEGLVNSLYVADIRMRREAHPYLKVGGVR